MHEVAIEHANYRVIGSTNEPAYGHATENANKCANSNSNEGDNDDATLVGVCGAGYTCGGGAKYVTDGIKCELGYFCPEGTAAVDDSLKCPIGTFGKRDGLQQIEHCSPCPGGNICSDPGLTLDQLNNPIYICPEGEYCNPEINQADCPINYLSTLIQLLSVGRSCPLMSSKV